MEGKGKRKKQEERQRPIRQEALHADRSRSKNHRQHLAIPVTELLKRVRRVVRAMARDQTQVPLGRQWRASR